MDHNIDNLGHIGVLMGGCSSEREISLKSGKAVYQALKDKNCHVSAVDITSRAEPDVISLLNRHKIDIAFIALHGEFGEDGGIQAILEKIGMPYTGSGAAVSRLTMNKIDTQNLLKEDFSLAPFCVISKQIRDPLEYILQELGGFPVVVKPPTEGSSIGITIVQEQSALKDALELGYQYGREMLIEKYIKGNEITAGILNGRALPLVEIRPESDFFNFSAKYQKGLTRYIVPAQISHAVSEKIQRIAVEAFKKLGCRDFARLDFILDEKDEAFILEANTIPGFTETSLLPMAAQAADIGFGDLCLMIARLAAKRNVNIEQVID